MNISILHHSYMDYSKFLTNEIQDTLNKLIKKDLDKETTELVKNLNNLQLILKTDKKKIDNLGVPLYKREYLREKLTRYSLAFDKEPEYLINSGLNLINELEIKHTQMIDKVSVAASNLKDTELVLQQKKKEYAQYARVADSYNGGFNSDFYKKMPELKKVIDKLNIDIPKLRNEYNAVKEPEVNLLKTIEFYKKDIELCRVKLLTSKTTKEVNNDDNSLLLKQSSGKECWMCDGECTCDD